MIYKYTTYTALAKAFKTGELDRRHWKLFLDNDNCRLGWVGPVPAGDAGDAFVDQKHNESRELFRGNGYDDLAEAVAAAGIPCEWV